MPNILYIHPTFNQNKYVIPMGTIAVMNQIIEEKKGVYSDEVTTEEIEESRIIIMDLHWYHSLWAVIEMARNIKLINHSVYIILGGYTATIYAEVLINEYNIDYIIKGDGEISIAKLVTGLLNSVEVSNLPNTISKKNPVCDMSPAKQEDFDTLNYYTISWFPTFEKIVKEHCQNDIFHGDDNSFWPIVPVNRGCPYSCTFCYGSNDNTKRLFGRACIFRSAHRIKEDLIQLDNNSNINNIYFIGDFICFFNKQNCEEILDRNYNLNLYYEFFNLPTIYLLDLLVSKFLNCHLTFSLYKNHGESSELQDLSLLNDIIEYLKKKENIKFEIFAHKNQENDIPSHIIPYVTYNDSWHVEQPDPNSNNKDIKLDFLKFMEVSKNEFVIKRERILQTICDIKIKDSMKIYYDKDKQISIDSNLQIIEYKDKPYISIEMSSDISTMDQFRFPIIFKKCTLLKFIMDIVGNKIDESYYYINERYSITNDVSPMTLIEWLARNNSMVLSINTIRSIHQCFINISDKQEEVNSLSNNKALDMARELCLLLKKLIIKKIMLENEPIEIRWNHPSMEKFNNSQITFNRSNVVLFIQNHNVNIYKIQEQLVYHSDIESVEYANSFMNTYIIPEAIATDDIKVKRMFGVLKLYT